MTARNITWTFSSLNRHFGSFVAVIEVRTLYSNLFNFYSSVLFPLYCIRASPRILNQRYAARRFYCPTMSISCPFFFKSASRQQTRRKGHTAGYQVSRIGMIPIPMLSVSIRQRCVFQVESVGIPCTSILSRHLLPPGCPRWPKNVPSGAGFSGWSGRLCALSSGGGGCTSFHPIGPGLAA